MRRVPLSIPERRDRALLFLAERSGSPGQSIRFSGHVDEWMRVNQEGLQAHTESRDSQEATAFLRFLADDQFLVAEHDGYRLTYRGWTQVDDLKKQRRSSLQAFVAMWFDDSMSDAYAIGIEPAIVASGFRSVRIDRKDHVNKIDDEIIAEIRRSRFVVADFTSVRGSPRGGVYFEAGFALGLGIPVIWCCHESLIDDVHFDTRQYNHILWRQPEELQAKLTNRIGAVIGDGPLKPL